MFTERSDNSLGNKAEQTTKWNVQLHLMSGSVSWKNEGNLLELHPVKTVLSTILIGTLRGSLSNIYD